MKNHNCFNGNGFGRKHLPQIGRSFDGILERKKFRKIGKSSVHNVRKTLWSLNDLNLNSDRRAEQQALRESDLNL